MLYIKFFVNEDGEYDLKIFFEQVLSIEVLNICTHFGNDYFKINSFYRAFYFDNFSNFLYKQDFGVEVNNDVDSDNFIFRRKNYDEDYLNFINDLKNFDILDLQLNVILMLKKLLVNFDSRHERKVAHYTNYNVAKLLATNETSLRLNSTDFMNDPTEGKILLQYMQLNEFEHNSHNKTFLACFTFNHNSLNQFRLYGLSDNVPCSGVSLVYGSNFFFNFESIINDYLMERSDIGRSDSEYLHEGLKIPLFRCIYLDSFTGHFEVAKRNKFTFYQELQDRLSSSNAWDIYIKEMNGIEDEVGESFDRILASIKLMKAGNHNLSIDQLKNANKILKPICYLVKHFSFQEEQECRMIVIDKIDSEKVVMDINDNSRSFVEYDQPTHRDINNIYIGLASAMKMVDLLKTIKSKNNRNCPKTMISDNPYRI